MGIAAGDCAAARPLDYGDQVERWRVWSYAGTMSVALRAKRNGDLFIAKDADTAQQKSP
jgi:hypothetical protein